LVSCDGCLWHGVTALPAFLKCYFHTGVSATTSWKEPFPPNGRRWRAIQLGNTGHTGNCELRTTINCWFQCILWSGQCAVVRQLCDLTRNVAVQQVPQQQQAARHPPSLVGKSQSWLPVSRPHLNKLVSQQTFCAAGMRQRCCLTHSIPL